MPSSVNIVCLCEGKTVGTLPIPTSGAQAITHRWVCANFQPAASEYQIIAGRQRDGETLRCPRCGGDLTVEGAIFRAGEVADRKRTIAAVKSRDEIRAEVLARHSSGDRALSFAAGAGMPIVLGATRFEVKP